MDQYLSTIIIAVITGVFGVITAIINKKNEDVISKIDEQARIVQKERELKKSLAQKERERNEINNRIRLLILDTNLYIMQNMNLNGGIDPEVIEEYEDLKKRYADITEDIKRIKTEYDAIAGIASEFNNNNS